jgi:hypothetical protein
MPTQPHVASLWAATALPAPNLPKLDADLETDVVVIGGGFSGRRAAPARKGATTWRFSKLTMRGSARRYGGYIPPVMTPLWRCAQTLPHKRT